MTGFLHGVRVLEITSTGAAGRPLPQPDFTAPHVTSASNGRSEVGWSYVLHLSALETVSFEKRPGGAGTFFLLENGVLTLPPQLADAIGRTFSCPLRAIDGAGNVTDFAHAVSITPAMPGELNFADPSASGLQ